jgi:hypothetical protein
VIRADIFDPECLGIERRISRQRLDATSDLLCSAFGRVSRHSYYVKPYLAVNHYRRRIHYFECGRFGVRDLDMGLRANDW